MFEDAVSYYLILCVMVVCSVVGILHAQQPPPLTESFEIPTPARRIPFLTNAINYRIVAFDSSLPNIQQIVKEMGAKVVQARRPTASDDKRLSAYGKYLKYACNGRHTDSHYNYSGAFGIALVSIDTLWKEAAQTNLPSVIFEENTRILNFMELRRCVSFCMHNNIDFMQIHTVSNGNPNHSFGDRCPIAPKQAPGKPIRISQTGVVYPLTHIYTSMKCYYISPRFAKHMCAVAENYIDNLHIDVWLCMEARFPSGVDHTHRPFVSYVYRGSPPCVTMLDKRRAGITTAILHTPVYRNTID